MKIYQKYRHLAYCSALTSYLMVASPNVFAEVTYYTADANNSNVSSIDLIHHALGNPLLQNPGNLALASPGSGYEYKYVAVQFTALEDGTYQFGMTSSPVDTIMVLYNGVYNPSNPGQNALVGNDDTLASIHKNNVGDSNLNVLCGPHDSYCPLVSQTVTAGQTYTLWVSVFASHYNSQFNVPFNFYSTGSVIFGAHTGRSPIDLAQPFYLASELGKTVDPQFIGGTLKMDRPNEIISENFTLANMSTNTIDMNGIHSTFSGIFSDAVPGNAGHITFDNVGSVTLTGHSTYTGSTTLKNGQVNISQSFNLGANQADIRFDGGRLNVLSSFNSAHPISLLSTGTLSVANNSTLTISGKIGGTGNLSIQGGTVILSAENTFTGALNVSSADLQITNNKSLGNNNAIITLENSSLTALDNVTVSQNLSLNTATTIGAETGKTLILKRSLSSDNDLTINNQGSVVLNAQNSLGNITVQSGELIVGDASHPSTSLKASDGLGNITIQSKGALGGYGTIKGNIENKGLFAVGSAMPSLNNAGVPAHTKVNGNFLNNTNGTISLANGQAGDMLSINGDYKGTAGSYLLMDVQLAGNDSQKDYVHITGNATGNTTVQVKNTNGIGAKTTDDGIRIIQVNGISSDNAFTLRGTHKTKAGVDAIANGAYSYTLQKGATPENTDNWYLRSDSPKDGKSTLYSPVVPIAEAYPQTIMNMMEADTYRQRRGGYAKSEGTVSDPSSYNNSNSSNSDDIKAPALIWARVKGTIGTHKGENSQTGIKQEFDNWTLRSGADGVVYEDENQTFAVGTNILYGQNKTTVTSDHGDGTISTFGWGIGSTLTWRNEIGTYVDVQGQVLWHISDLSSKELGSIIEENSGLGYSGSIEVGHQFLVGKGFHITPQAQLAYYSIDFENFNDQINTRVSLRDNDRLTTRLGVSADKQFMWESKEGDIRHLQFYGIANVYYNVMNKTTVNVSGINFSHERLKTWGGLGLGTSYSWGGDLYNITGEINTKGAFEDLSKNKEASSTVRVRMRF